MSALFACSKCYSKHPFEELSQGQQLCKECRGSFPTVKCTYCRSEFQQASKSSTAAVCKKCDKMVRKHGKPSGCEYCNIIAAFIGTKCQRCSNSEEKYGSPQLCQQCKQKCAFDRKDDDKKKLDGKLLCWLCAVSYKKALMKTKVTDPARHSHVKLSSRHTHHKEKSRVHGHNKRPNRPDVTKMPVEEPPAKKRKTSGAHRDLDPTSGDQLVVITQLREKIATLEKQLNQKDSQLINKEKQMTELKANQYTAETEMRAKMKTLTRDHENRVDSLQGKIRELSKEVSSLKKGRNKKSTRTNQADRVGTLLSSSAANASGTDGASSGTDNSPVVT